MSVKTLSVWFIGVLLLHTTAIATTLTVQSEAAIKPDHPQSYTVQEGDTLWAVTSLFLKEPWRAGDVWAKNAPALAPGDEVSLIKQGERMVLQIKQGRVVKLSPGVRVPRKRREIQKIPVNEIRQFLNKPQVVTEDFLDDAPYVVASADERILMSEGNTIYVRNFLDEGIDRYKILHPGQLYRDGPEGEVLAREAVYLGEAVLEAEGDPATFRIVEAEREIRPGSRLLPIDEREFEDDFIPFAPLDIDEDAKIIAVIDGVSQIGQNNVVVINKGENDGLERGHVLAIYRGGDIVRDPFSGKADDTVKLPSLHAGTLMIFKTFGKVSFALVMQSNRPIFVNDAVDLP